MVKSGSVFRVLQDDPEGDYRVGDIGLIIERSAPRGLPFQWEGRDMFNVLLNGNLEALFDFEMEVIDEAG